MDPAQTGELHGPAALVDRLTSAEPMGRQLVDQALAGRDLTWPADHVAAARVAAGIIMQAPPQTWEREIEAVAGRTELDLSTLRTAVVNRIEPDADALGRLVGRDRRDDLDRGQHVTPTPAQLAAMSTPRTGPVRPAVGRPADATHAVHTLAAQGRGPH